MKITLLIFSLNIICWKICAQDSVISSQEKVCIDKINDLFFILRSFQLQGKIKFPHAKDSTSSGRLLNRPASDSQFINLIIEDYLLVLTSSKADSAQWKRDVSKFAKEIHTLRLFLYENAIIDPVIKPIRITRDRVSDYLTDFQKLHTFVVYSSKKADMPLLYMFVFPWDGRTGSDPHILSWVLAYGYGTYLFEDLNGEKGVEYLLEGVKGPTKPINL